MRLIAKRLALWSLVVMTAISTGTAQCEAGEVEIMVEIVPDSWPGEISWTLEMSGELLAESGADGATVCIDGALEDPCLLFTIADSYGDGILGGGGYWLYVNGEQVATGAAYGYGESVSLLCPPGSTCNDAVAIDASDYGVINQSMGNYWYVFTPEANGMYEFNTCGSGCNTTLWIYDYCNMGSFNNTNEGTIYYDDEQGGCGDEANLTVLLQGGVPVWIRMGLGAPDYLSLVSLNSEWNYHDHGADLGSEWTATDFDDADWALGNAELGYGDGDEATTVSYGDDSSDKHITTYFRNTFEYTGEASNAMNGLLRLRRDDGAVVYLNGVEIMRSNMPGGPVTSETTALSEIVGTNESTLYEYPVALNLNSGENVLAVEVHQINPTSSDISFDAELLLSDPNGTCAGGFDWMFNFAGPPTGCMDEEACNYNPLAEVDSGECIYPGDPDCTGPDLIVSAEAIVNSLSTQVMQVSETDCYIEEGCLNGYGDRELVRFTTHILNIGTLDYYIGVPSQADNNQFEWGDCHNHWHHKGYAKYDLFTLEGQYIPIGFKNGFCVMDLECSGGGTGQYGCGNMGISAGCGDIYGSGLSCQWIDVTDVEDGVYYLIVRANYDFIPDALGREENSYENNHAAVCISLDRSTGELEVDVMGDCEPFYDCEGTEFGTAMMDCNGECNGSALMGDLDANGAQEYADAVAYVEHILGNDIEALPCTDVDQDGLITVSDAAYLAQCQYWNAAHEHPDSSGFHPKCDFPVNHIVNPFDSVYFSIGSVNWDQGFLDIHVLNPNNRIVGYELNMSGMGISSAVSLADPIEYPIEPAFVPGGGKVIGLAYEGESLVKNYSWTPLLRLYWSDHEEEICIDAIIDVVNTDYHNTLTYILEGCVTASGISEAFTDAVPMLYPNPMQESSLLRFPNPKREQMTFVLTDASGREVMTWSTKGVQYTIERGDLPSGTYLYTLTTAQGFRYSGRLSIQ